MVQWSNGPDEFQWSSQTSMAKSNFNGPVDFQWSTCPDKFQWPSRISMVQPNFNGPAEFQWPSRISMVQPNFNDPGEFRRICTLHALHYYCQNANSDLLKWESTFTPWLSLTSTIVESSQKRTPFVPNYSVRFMKVSAS